MHAFVVVVVVDDVVVVVVVVDVIVTTFLRSSKLLSASQNRSGQTSVDRSAKTTLSTYNAWNYLSQLRTIVYICTRPCLVVYTTFSGRVVYKQKCPNLSFSSLAAV